MKSSYGENINIELTGESHADKVGVIITGLPIGTTFDAEELECFMKRRSGDRNDELVKAAVTERNEKDIPAFEEGIEPRAGSTAEVTGDRVVISLRNFDVRSSDYPNTGVLRPGHADLGVFLKEGRAGLKPGGGRFSGRMTAPMCLAGGILLQLLKKRGITIKAEIDEIGGKTAVKEMIEAVESAKKEGDSLGGTVKCTVSGFPEGVGGELFEGLEGKIACALLAIPSVKGIEFGSGFTGAGMKGSENNDEIFFTDGKLSTGTNNSGGILGGISTGSDIIFRVAFKPVPSISVPLGSVDVDTMTEVKCVTKGRHDVTVVPRVLPVVEAMTAAALYDVLADKDTVEK